MNLPSERHVEMHENPIATKSQSSSVSSPSGRIDFQAFQSSRAQAQKVNTLSDLDDDARFDGAAPKAAWLGDPATNETDTDDIARGYEQIDPSRVPYAQPQQRPQLRSAAEVSPPIQQQSRIPAAYSTQAITAGGFTQAEFAPTYKAATERDRRPPDSASVSANAPAPIKIPQMAVKPPYYHGAISASEAKRLISTAGNKPGLFLVRQHDKDTDMLVTCGPSGATESPLKRDGKTQLMTVGGKPISGASTLEDAVFNIRVRGSEFGLVLQEPVNRPDSPETKKKLSKQQGGNTEKRAIRSFNSDDYAAKGRGYQSEDNTPGYADPNEGLSVKSPFRPQASIASTASNHGVQEYYTQPPAREYATLDRLASAVTVELSPSKFQLERMIGQGQFGQVYSAIELETRRPVAVKVLKSQNG